MSAACPGALALESFHDGDLPDAERDTLAVHLAGCDTCRAKLEELEAMAGLLRELPREAVSAELIRSVVSAALAAEPEGLLAAADSGVAEPFDRDIEDSIDDDTDLPLSIDQSFPSEPVAIAPPPARRRRNWAPFALAASALLGALVTWHVIRDVPSSDLASTSARTVRLESASERRAPASAEPAADQDSGKLSGNAKDDASIKKTELADAAGQVQSSEGSSLAAVPSSRDAMTEREALDVSAAPEAAFQRRDAAEGFAANERSADQVSAPASAAPRDARARQQTSQRTSPVAAPPASKVTVAESMDSTAMEEPAAESLESKRSANSSPMPDDGPAREESDGVQAGAVVSSPPGLPPRPELSPVIAPVSPQAVGESDAHREPVPVATPGVTPPRLVTKVSATLPASWRDDGIPEVMLRVIVRSDGSVGVREILRGPKELQTPAIDAVRKWQYQPATRDGVALPVLMTVRVPFQP